MGGWPCRPAPFGLIRTRTSSGAELKLKKQFLKDARLGQRRPQSWRKSWFLLQRVAQALEQNFLEFFHFSTAVLIRTKNYILEKMVPVVSLPYRPNDPSSGTSFIILKVWHFLGEKEGVFCSSVQKYWNEKLKEQKEKVKFKPCLFFLFGVISCRITIVLQKKLRGGVWNFAAIFSQIIY